MIYLLRFDGSKANCGTNIFLTQVAAPSSATDRLQLIGRQRSPWSETQLTFKVYRPCPYLS